MSAVMSSMISGVVPIVTVPGLAPIMAASACKAPFPRQMGRLLVIPEHAREMSARGIGSFNRHHVGSAIGRAGDATGLGSRLVAGAGLLTGVGTQARNDGGRRRRLLGARSGAKNNQHRRRKR